MSMQRSVMKEIAKIIDERSTFRRTETINPDTKASDNALATNTTMTTDEHTLGEEPIRSRKFKTLELLDAKRKCVHPLCCTRLSYLRESWLRPLVLSGDMLGSRAFVLLTIFNFVYRRSTEQIINSNGWIPMTHNDIYNQIRRTTMSKPTTISNHYIKATEYPLYRTMMPPIKYDNNLVQRQINTKKDLRDVKESLEDLNEKPFYAAIVADNVDKNHDQIVNSKDFTREPKQVWNHDIDTNNNNIVDIHKIDSTKQESDKTMVVNQETAIDNVIKATASSKSYEVIEVNDSTATEDVGYQYNPPTDENQNLTSTFYKILSKYNINSEDRLPNYHLSLQRKVQNPLSGGYRVPLPFGYNNLNHLPVDPLLAVFLSNYGCYLPSLYGIKANYNNLYGYLASNNIHNNRPFGLYKVFSDTDSWN